MAEKKPLVSISVINWNGILDTERCLRSIRKFTSYPRYEVIVIDNASSDGSVERLEQLKKEGLIHNLILNSENQGNTIGYNQGLKAARGEYVLLLDNDTEIIEGQWLEKLVDVAQGEKNLGMLGCQLLPRPENDSWQPNVEKQIDVKCVCGAAMLIPRNAARAVGEFDEKFSPGYYEEVDYCERLRKNGLRVVYSPQPKIRHAGAGSFKKMPDTTYFLSKRNRLRMQLLNFPAWKLIFLLPYDFAVSVAGGLLKGKLGLVLKAYGENLRGWGEISAKRRAR